MKKFSAFLFGPLLIGVIVFASSCGPSLHQTKVKMIPDPGSIFVEKDYNEMFDYAMLTGLELGYRVVHSNKGQGIISFTKEVGPMDPVSVNINLYIIKVNEKEAYVNIAMQCSRFLSDLTLREFTKHYVSKWKE